MPKIMVKQLKQESAHRQMDTHMHTLGRYQTYYLPATWLIMNVLFVSDGSGGGA